MFLWQEKPAALRLYRREGFPEVGRIPCGFLHDGMEIDEVLMARRLLLREAQEMVRALIHIGAQPDMDPILVAYGIDRLDHAERLAAMEGWPEKFREHQIENAVANARERRALRIAERERRRPGFMENPFSG